MKRNIDLFISRDTQAKIGYLLPPLKPIVLGEKETVGFRALADEGMLDMAFESVILKYPEVFSEENR